MAQGSGSYLEPIFLEQIRKEDVCTVFELGSRDLRDAYDLQRVYNAEVYAFECNPDCLAVCRANQQLRPNDRVHLVSTAVTLEDGPASFFPFDLEKYDNMGASSMLRIDFSRHAPTDPDFCRPNPQTEVRVAGTRLDTFLDQRPDIERIDMLCIDLQGYELNALISMGQHLSRVKYIIVECAIRSTYVGGAAFVDVAAYLGKHGFTYRCSNGFGRTYPNVNAINGICEFDALFVHS